MSGYGFAVGSSGYDDEDRLVNWQRADTNLDQSWDLSLVGNWDTYTENASAQSRTHGPTHELLTVASQGVTHDAKGNMTLIPAVLRPSSDPLKMKWDFENKLIAADTDDDSVDDVFYRFDALGRRVGRDDGTVNAVYFQDGQQTIADYPAGTAAGSPTYTYVYASYIDEPVLRGGSGGLRYYHRNQQYSITALTDGGGSIAERYAYTAYGQVTFANASGTVQATSASNNRITYTGREWDQGLSLYYYRARMYDAESGRFVSRDPIGFEGSHWNLYAISDGNPVIRVDPNGLSWCSDFICFLAYAAIAADIEAAFRYNNLPDRDDQGGGNAMLHCTIACEIQKQIPRCSDEWNDREDPTTLAGQQDLFNNRTGQGLATSDCWGACKSKWDSGGLGCSISGAVAPCPPAPGDFPDARPPRPGI